MPPDSSVENFPLFFHNNDSFSDPPDITFAASISDSTIFLHPLSSSRPLPQYLNSFLHLLLSSQSASSIIVIFSTDENSPSVIILPVNSY